MFHSRGGFVMAALQELSTAAVNNNKYCNNEEDTEETTDPGNERSKWIK